MRLRAGLRVAILLAGTACSFGIRIEPPPPPPPEIPVPRPYAAPAQVTPPESSEIRLQPSEYPGLDRAPDIDPRLFHSRADGLWYRYWKGRWYQAFRWDGYWFPPAELPDALRAGAAPRGAPTEAKPPPAADARTRGMPRDAEGLPTLPEFLPPDGDDDGVGDDPNAQEEIED